MKRHTTEKSTVKGGVVMSIKPIKALDYVNETTLAEIDMIAQHHHAGHPYYSCMPFSTESVQPNFVNELLILRGVGSRFITWLPRSKYGFCLRIKPKSTKRISK